MTARTIGAVGALAAAAALSAALLVGTDAAATHKGPLIVLDTDAGQLNDHGFNQLAYEGLQRAEKKLGVNGKVYQAASSQDYVPNLARAAQAGAALVISVGFDQANAIAHAGQMAGRRSARHHRNHSSPYSVMCAALRSG